MELVSKVGLVSRLDDQQALDVSAALARQLRRKCAKYTVFVRTGSNSPLGILARLQEMVAGL